MKKKTNKIRIRIWHENCMRKKRRTKKKIRSNHIRRKSRKFKYNDKKQKDNSFFNKNEITLPISSHFSLLESPEEVISFIKRIEETTKGNHIKKIKFDLSEIVSIDMGAICLLLSKMNELSGKGIRYWGTFPKDNDCKQFIEDSGFLDRMRDISSGKPFPRTNKNMILNRGSDKTDNTQIAKEIRKAVKHLTNEENNYKPIYSIVQEICANSIEHANEQVHEKNWLFTTSYLENRVIFTMTDIGEGILKTIKRKISKRIKELNDNPTDILMNAFDKKYESRTEESNRNKGLPKIRKIAGEEYIENLIVITNNVLLDFDNQSQRTKKLQTNFKGTFYYWILNKKCIERWKKRFTK
jgi:ABC-type transporter Mla MlaB component/anti-sigma regulatory factor (Ser/Thr protein kinase)